MQTDPPLWFSINAGLLLYLTLASVSYLAGRVPKKLYKAEVREFIEREYRRAPQERVRIKPTARVALEPRALPSSRKLREVIVVDEPSSSGSESEETATRIAEREAYRQYFRAQSERARPADEAAVTTPSPVDDRFAQLAGCGQPSHVKHL